MSNLAEILARGDFSVRPFKNTKPIAHAYGVSDGANPVEPYVIPVGRKALWASYAWNNPGAGAGSLRVGVKKANGARRVIQQNAIAAGVNNAANQPVILSAGESPSFDTMGVAGVICAARALMEFDDDGTIFRIDADLGLGDNLLYTVPAGKQAVLFTSSLSIAVTSSPFFTVGNFTGANKTLVCHVLPAGVNVTSASTRWGSSVVVANNIAGFPTCIKCILDEGQKLILNSDGAGGANLWAFINVLLLDK